MKTNLKTFPDVHEWFYRKQVHDWKERFEKELREMLTKGEEAEKRERQDKNWRSTESQVILNVVYEQNLLLKQILGEM